MKKMILQLTLLFLVTGLTACSNQWRESDPSVSEDDAFQLYDELNVAVSGASSTLIDDLRNDEGSAIYYAESGGSFGEAKSVFSFSDLGFLGYDVGTTVFDIGLNYAGVIFVDALSSNNERHFALMLKLGSDQSQNAQTFTFVSEPGAYSFSDDKFEVSFNLQDGTTLVLRSYDVDQKVSDELAPTIHLKAYIIENGQEFAIGQISSLRGFGG